MDEITVARVRWTREGRIKVFLDGNKKPDVYTQEEFAAGVLPADTHVHVPYQSGPTLIGWIADMVEVKQILAGFVCSECGTCSPIRDVTLDTLKLWRTPSPETLMGHPAISRIAPFCPNGSASALATVVTTVFDPRWYVDDYRPNRWSALECAFGLEPRYDKQPRRNRAVLAQCWCPPNGPTDSPADFYGRYHKAQLGLGNSPSKAIRKVGRHFLRSLAAGWMDGISQYRGIRGEPLFDPCRMYDRTSLVAAGLVGV